MSTKANDATIPQALLEIWKLGHRKDFGGQDAETILKSRMPAVLTPDSVAEFTLNEINRCLQGNKMRAEPYYARLKALLGL